MKTVANELTRDLIKGVDLGNTVLGGMSESYMKHIESENSYAIEIRTPGLGAENYQIDLKNNVLFLYSTMQIQKENDFVQAPYLMRHFSLPYYVDLDEISAECQGQTLRINIPYKYLKDGFEKKIEIF